MSKKVRDRTKTLGSLEPQDTFLITYELVVDFVETQSEGRVQFIWRKGKKYFKTNYVSLAPGRNKVAQVLQLSLKSQGQELLNKNGHCTKLTVLDEYTATLGETDVQTADLSERKQQKIVNLGIGNAQITVRQKARIRLDRYHSPFPELEQSSEEEYQESSTSAQRLVSVDELCRLRKDLEDRQFLLQKVKADRTKLAASLYHLEAKLISEHQISLKKISQLKAYYENKIEIRVNVYEDEIERLTETNNTRAVENSQLIEALMQQLIRYETETEMNRQEFESKLKKMKSEHNIAIIVYQESQALLETDVNSLQDDRVYLEGQLQCIKNEAKGYQSQLAIVKVRLQETQEEYQAYRENTQQRQQEQAEQKNTLEEELQELRLQLRDERESYQLLEEQNNESEINLNQIRAKEKDLNEKLAEITAQTAADAKEKLRQQLELNSCLSQLQMMRQKLSLGIAQQGKLESSLMQLNAELNNANRQLSQLRFELSEKSNSYLTQIENLNIEVDLLRARENTNNLAIEQISMAISQRDDEINAISAEIKSLQGKLIEENQKCLEFYDRCSSLQEEIEYMKNISNAANEERDEAIAAKEYLEESLKVEMDRQMELMSRNLDKTIQSYEEQIREMLKRPVSFQPKTDNEELERLKKNSIDMEWEKAALLSKVNQLQAELESQMIKAVTRLTHSTSEKAVQINIEEQRNDETQQIRNLRGRTAREILRGSSQGSFVDDQDSRAASEQNELIKSPGASDRTDSNNFELAKKISRKTSLNRIGKAAQEQAYEKKNETGNQSQPKFYDQVIEIEKPSFQNPGMRNNQASKESLESLPKESAFRSQPNLGFIGLEKKRYVQRNSLSSAHQSVHSSQDSGKQAPEDKSDHQSVQILRQSKRSSRSKFLEEQLNKRLEGQRQKPKQYLNNLKASSKGQSKFAAGDSIKYNQQSWHQEEQLPSFAPGYSRLPKTVDRYGGIGPTQIEYTRNPSFSQSKIQLIFENSQVSDNGMASLGRRSGNPAIIGSTNISNGMSVQHELFDLKLRLQAVESERKELQLKLEHTLEQLNALQNDALNYKDNNKRLTQDLSSLRTQLTSSQQTLLLKMAEAQGLSMRCQIMNKDRDSKVAELQYERELHEKRTNELMTSQKQSRRQCMDLQFQLVKSAQNTEDSHHRAHSQLINKMAVLVPENQRLKSELNRLTNRCTELEQSLKKNNIITFMGDIRSDLDHANSKINDLNRMLSSVRLDKANLQEEIMHLKSKLDERSKRLQDSERVKNEALRQIEEAERKQARLKHDQQDSQDHLTRLRQHLRRAEHEVVTLKNSQFEVANEKSRLNDDRQRIMQAYAEKEQQLLQMQRDMTRTKSRLENEEAKLFDSAKDLRDRCSQLEGIVSQRNEQIKVLKDRQEKLEKVAQRSQQESKAYFSEKLQHYVQQLNELNASVEACQADNSQLKLQLVESIEQIEFQKIVSQSEADKTAEVNRQKEAAEEQSKQRQAQMAQLQLLCQKHQQGQREAESLAKKNSEEVNRIRKSLEQADNRERFALNRLTQLQQQMSVMKVKFEDYTLVVSKCQRLKHEIEAKSNEIQSLQAELKNDRQNGFTLTKMQPQHHKLESMIQQARNQQRHEAQKKWEAKMKSVLEEAKERHVKLEHGLAQLMQQNSKLNEQLQRAQAKSSELANQLGGMSALTVPLAEYEREKRIRAEVEEKLQQHVSELNRLKRKHQRQQSEFRQREASIQSTLDELTAEKMDYKKQAESTQRDLKKKIAQLEERINVGNDVLLRLKRSQEEANTLLEKTNEEYMFTVKNKTKGETQLNEALMQEQQKVSRLKISLEKALSEGRERSETLQKTLKVENQRLMDSLKATSDELRATRADFDELESSLIRSQQALDTSQRQFSSESKISSEIISKLQQEGQEWRQKSEAARPLNEQVKSLQVQVQRYQSDDRLKKSEQRLKIKQSQVQDLRKEVTALEEALSKKTKRETQLQQTYNQQIQLIEGKMQLNQDSFALQISNLEVQLRDQTQLAFKLKEKVALVELESLQKERKRQFLQSELQFVSKSAKEVEEQLKNQLETANQTISTQQDQISHRTQAQRASSLREATLNGECEQRQRQILVLAAQLAQSNSSYSQLQAEARQTKAELEYNSTSIIELTEQLERALSQAQRQQERLKQTNESIKQVELELRWYQEREEQLKSELGCHDLVSFVHGLNRRLIEQSQQLEEYKFHCERYQLDIQQVKSAHCQLQLRNEELELFNNRMEHLRDLCDELERQKKEAQSQSLYLLESIQCLVREGATDIRQKLASIIRYADAEKTFSLATFNLQEPINAMGVSRRV